MNSIHASNIELAMQSSLTFEVVVCTLLETIFENVHNLSTGCAKISLRPQHFLIPREARPKASRSGVYNFVPQRAQAG